MPVLSTVCEEAVCLNHINSLRSVSKINCETEINYCMLFAFLTIIILCFFFLILNQNEHILGQNQIQSESVNESSVLDYPSLSDGNLKVETVAAGFTFPTGITFLRNNEILLLEKNTGNIYRIVNGTVSGIALHLNVSIEDERGLLGVAVSRIDKSNQDNPFV